MSYCLSQNCHYCWANDYANDTMQLVRLNGLHSPEGCSEMFRILQYLQRCTPPDE